VEIAFYLFGGLAVGLFYFTGLWWTVRGLAKSRHSGIRILGSFFSRAALSLWLVYLMTGGCWQGVLWVMGGFLFARVILVRHWRPASAKSIVEG
jgi:F1F0 ATPase subunit 2